MSWPTMSDYQEAVQSPRACFSDAQLKSGTPTLNALGLPQPITGGFASVYQILNGKGRWAVRCFLHRIPDIQERYALISRALRKNPLRSMVGFEYLPEGIRVKGSWYATLKMEWVDGDTLNVYVKKNVKSPRALLKLADRWADLVDSLERAGIAHGDLQHGNVLVKDGEFKLIDYDGVFVPALKGRGSHEKGHPCYQHPLRSGDDFDEAADRFSALVIHLSFLALAREPKLWGQFYDEDNLLFRRQDFITPAASPVFKALEGLGDPQVAALTECLRKACKGTVADAPRLRDALAGRRPAVAMGTADPAGKVKEAPRPAVPKPAPRPAPVPALVAALASAGPPVAMPGPLHLPRWLDEKPAPRPAAPPAAPPAPGWKVDWVRPGELPERHVYKEPVYGTREVSRRFLFIPMGMKRVKFVERYEDRVKERTARVEGHRSRVTALAFSADGGTLASGSLDRTLRVWSVPTGRELSPCLDTRAGVLALAMVPGRAAVAAVLEDRRLVLWDYGLQRQIVHLNSPDRSRLEAVAVSPDGRWVAAGGKGRSAFVWDANRGTPVESFEDLDGKVVLLAFTADGSGLVCAARNGRLMLFDRASRKARWNVRTSRLNTLIVSPRGSGVVAVTDAGAVKTWDLRDGRELPSPDPRTPGVDAAGLTPDGTHGIYASGRQARVSRAGGGAPLAVLEAHPRRLTAVALSPTLRAAATACKDGSLRLWSSR